MQHRVGHGMRATTCVPGGAIASPSALSLRLLPLFRSLPHDLVLWMELVVRCSAVPMIPLIAGIVAKGVEVQEDKLIIQRLQTAVARQQHRLVEKEIALQDALATVRALQTALCTEQRKCEALQRQLPAHRDPVASISKPSGVVIYDSQALTSWSVLPVQPRDVSTDTSTNSSSSTTSRSSRRRRPRKGTFSSGCPSPPSAPAPIA